MWDFDKIKKYWENRAKDDDSKQSTTNDVYLREIEARVLSEFLLKLAPKKIADVGCGDGFTTITSASKLPRSKFSGFDYSESMILNANNNLSKTNLNNVSFNIGDITSPINGSFELIYTTRCLINIPDIDLQYKAIQNIHSSLLKDGYFIMIENFIEGQNNFNELRKAYGLPLIQIREHNLFFNRDVLIQNIKDIFNIEYEINISSTYYMMSRIIYSKLCADSCSEPDYYNEHHRYASTLPFSGEYGPLRLLLLKKK